MRVPLRRLLAVLIAAVTVVALVLVGSFVYAQSQVGPRGDAPTNDELTDADTVLPTDKHFAGTTTGASTEGG